VGTPSNVTLGPGQVYVAPLGTAEPTDASTALIAAYRDVGYTEGGTTFNYALTIENVTVDQELDPIARKVTSRDASVTFTMAEATGKNLALALNVGADATVSTGFEPPDPGTELRIMIVFQADTGARYLFRQCVQGGSISVQSAKAPAKRLIATTFSCEIPNGAKPFKIFPAADGTI
jgi:hypothetical protein